MNEAERLDELARQEKLQQQQELSKPRDKQRRAPTSPSSSSSSSAASPSSSTNAAVSSNNDAAAKQTPPPPTTTSEYNTRIAFRLQSGSKNFRVLHKHTERVEALRNPNNSNNPHSPLVPPSTQHTDVIADIQIVPHTQWASQLVVSASRDGVVKVWK
jgi:hypothetical protein